MTEIEIRILSILQEDYYSGKSRSSLRFDVIATSNAEALHALKNLQRKGYIDVYARMIGAWSCSITEYGLAMLSS